MGARMQAMLAAYAAKLVGKVEPEPEKALEDGWNRNRRKPILSLANERHPLLLLSPTLLIRPSISKPLGVYGGSFSVRADWRLYLGDRRNTQYSTHPSPPKTLSIFFPHITMRRYVGVSYPR